jgi:hypothetical protein
MRDQGLSEVRRRWRDTASSQPDAAGQLFQKLDRPGLTPEQLERVRGRITQSIAQGAASGGLSPLGRSSLVRGVLLLLGLGGAVVLALFLGSGAHKAVRRAEPAVPASPPPVALAAGSPTPEDKPEPAHAPEPAPAPPASDAPPAAVKSEAPPRPEIRAAHRHALRAPAPTPPPSPAATETVPSQPPLTAPEVPAPPAPTPAEPPSAVEFQLVSAAVQQLRQKGSPLTALRTLDAYDSRFPHGELRPEATWLRVQALVQLGQRREALKILDEQPLSADGERSAEPLVLRGELRSEAGRCGDALPDLEAAAALASGEMLERTLLYRGRCRARTGDAPGARADYSVYLIRFPTGRYTDEIRKSLRELPAAPER